MTYPPRELRHRIALAYLDLDELPALIGGRLVRRRPGVVRIRRRDLLGGAQGGGGDVRAAVRELIAERTGRPAAQGPIRVLTHPRVLGTCFNPVSFYYAFDACERLDAVVAEVTNTPWGERRAYVLRGGPEEADDEGARVLRGTHAKVLHVSPFQPMERRHEWAASTPGQTLSVHIANRPPGETVPDFNVTLALHREQLTAGALRRETARQPAGTMRIVALIYGHALGLRLRGAQRFRHSEAEPEVTEP
jgi:DUF1365 family protein